MKFTGELKFPEIDHPGVPVRLDIEGSQLELLVEGESLGRWSLYDVRARRLVASAFQIELDGSEVTFVADDPIDFAYRGVEHMAETWATLKSKRIASRTIAVRRSRKGATPPRIEDMKAAMLSNLEDASAPRHLAGEVVLPESAAPPTSHSTAEDEEGGDWDRRDGAGAIPMVDQGEEGHEPGPAPPEDLQWIEEEKRRLAEERAQLEEERRLAERREEDRVEAYRLEMERLRVEREELQRKAVNVAGEDARVGTGVDEPVVTEDEPEEPEIQEPGEPESEIQEPEVEEPQLVEPEVQEREDSEGPELEAPEEPEEPELEELELEAPEEPEEPEVEQEPTPGVVDLNDLEDGTETIPEPEPEPVGAAPGASTPQPAAAASAGRERSGLMGAVRSAFRSGSRDHDHQFVEAPGGIGITRYVCEECGYVSIS